MTWTGDLTPTLSLLELLWILGALIGFIFTFLTTAAMAYAAWVVARYVRAGQASWTGPRWRFVSGMLLAMFCFLPGWGLFFTLGAIAGDLPPPPPSAEEATSFAFALSAMILGGEICIAIGQAAMAWVWFTVWRSPQFTPAASAPSPITPEEGSHVVSESNTDPQS